MIVMQRCIKSNTQQYFRTQITYTKTELIIGMKSNELLSIFETDFAPKKLIFLVSRCMFCYTALVNGNGHTTETSSLKINQKLYMIT